MLLCLVPLFFLTILLPCSLAQDINMGSCSGIPVQKNFDINKFSGHWYEIARNPTIFEAELKCNQVNYTVEGNYLSVINYGTSIRYGNQITMEGNATIPDPNIPSRWNIQYLFNPLITDYRILGTNYNDSAVVYSCARMFNVLEAEYLWILARTPTLSKTSIAEIFKFLRKNMIHSDVLYVNKDDC